MELDRCSEIPSHVLPSSEALEHARSSLISTLPSTGIGLERIQEHITNDLVPGLNKPNTSPNYYGFIIGGTTAAASFADGVVTANDQNVHVHLPGETIATEVEDRALRMVCELLQLSPDEWPHRTFSTGATASNVLGLACGREYVIREAAVFEGRDVSVAEQGIHDAMRMAGIDNVQVLTTVPHSSLRKAAAIVGLGRACVRDVGRKDIPHRFDFDALREALGRSRVASIVAVSCAEVNTGLFATDMDDMKKLRDLCDQHGAWIHVDAAFGLLARSLPDTAEYRTVKRGVEGIEMADSITGDAHKLLNVPYDCGIFLSRHLSLGTQVFHNPNAAYLSTSSNPSNSGIPTIPSPLNIGLENSRRFRALPVYASLAAYGRAGYSDMLERQVRLARAVAMFVRDSPDYVLLGVPPSSSPAEGGSLSQTFMVVLFRAHDEAVNRDLVRRINGSRRIYVSGTQWEGEAAARLAVANWQVDVNRDLKLVKEVLVEAALGGRVQRDEKTQKV